MKSKELKRTEALLRNKFWALLPTDEKIAHLRTRVGESKKQISRLKMEGKN